MYWETERSRHLGAGQWGTDIREGKLIRECSWPEELVQEVLQYLEGREEELHLVVSSLSGGYAKKGTEFPLLEQLMTPELV
ncbi:MAG: hypothetical protein ACLRSL_01355 [Streptococcus sp.]